MFVWLVLGFGRKIIRHPFTSLAERLLGPLLFSCIAQTAQCGKGQQRETAGRPVGGPSADRDRPASCTMRFAHLSGGAVFCSRLDCCCSVGEGVFPAYWFLKGFVVLRGKITELLYSSRGVVLEVLFDRNVGHPGTVYHTKMYLQVIYQFRYENA